MKKNSYLFLSILLSLIFIETSYLAANEVSLPNSIEQYSIEQSKSVKFDKKRYNELVKKILRTKLQSFLSSAANKTFKEIFYLCASGSVGTIIGSQVCKSDNLNLGWAEGLFFAALIHTTMRLLFDYMLVSKDQNLQNLENFEKYVQEALSSEGDLIKNNSDLILRLFEKDYGLISNKLDQDRGAGVPRRVIKWLFKESIFCLESGVFGAAVGAYFLSNGTTQVNSIGAVISAGLFYYILLTLVFDVLLAGSDQHLLKIEKLRDIDQFIEEIKIKKLELQHEHVALAVE